MSSPDELTALIFTLGRRLRERVMADGASISYLHLATLRYIEEEKQPLMREIAHYLRVSPPSATSLVNTLVKQGEIRRVADAHDRRAVRLSVTTQGRKTLENGARRKHDMLRHAIKDLSDRERAALKKILEKIIRTSSIEQ